MPGLQDSVDRLAAETGFSGVVRVDNGDATLVERAYGLANRAYGLDLVTDAQLGIASGTKGLTALTVVRLIERGRLELATTARSVLGADLPLIDERVTVEHLLAHRSGIGDYLDEEVVRDINDYTLTVPVHQLTSTERYLSVLDGHPAKAVPGERFSYCNGGFVVLALIAERVGGQSFAQLVDELVCRPAGMTATAFLRADELPARAAIGYLHSGGLRSNVLHLPVLGSGDGGIYSTAADVHAFWAALFSGRIVSPEWVKEMVRPRSQVPSGSRRYGLGFWLASSGRAVELHGADAGVSFRSVHHAGRELTHTVLGNTSKGAWPITALLDERLEL